MAIHDLKVYPPHFDALKSGEKPFEVRRDDRGFQKGDVLVLHHFDPLGERGVDDPPLVRLVSYVLRGGQFGIEPGFVVMGLGDPPIPDCARPHDQSHSADPAV